MLVNKLATNNEYRIVLDIWERSARATHDFLAEEDLNFFKKEIPKHLESVELLLWYDEDQIVGFSGTDDTELVMLFLDPDIIGKGYGSFILRWLMENRNINRIDVNAQNDRAKAFYLRHGFVEIAKSETDGYGKPYPIAHLSLKKNKE